MKTIGIIGGLTWESTQGYYAAINTAVRLKLGGSHSARCIIVSEDFFEVESLQNAGRWDEAGALIVDAAKRLKRAGADLLVIASNTSHKYGAPAIEAAGLNLPLIHIADATAEAIVRDGIKTIGLVGTRWTMEESWYRGHLEQQGLTVVIPDSSDREVIHACIFDELAAGGDGTKANVGGVKDKLLGVIAKLVEAGAEGIVLGCTELGAIVKHDVGGSTKLYDTTSVHALAAVEASLTTAAAPKASARAGQGAGLGQSAAVVDIGESAVFGLGRHVRSTSFGDCLDDSGDVFEDVIDDALEESQLPGEMPTSTAAGT